MFGNLPIKAEGQAAHPDAYGIGYDNGEKFGSDEHYLKQLKAYSEWRGVEETMQEQCSRPHLLSKIQKGGLMLQKNSEIVSQDFMVHCKDCVTVIRSVDGEPGVSLICPVLNCVRVLPDFFCKHGVRKKIKDSSMFYKWEVIVIKENGAPRVYTAYGSYQFLRDVATQFRPEPGESVVSITRKDEIPVEKELQKEAIVDFSIKCPGCGEIMTNHAVREKNMACYTPGCSLYGISFKRPTVKLERA